MPSIATEISTKTQTCVDDIRHEVQTGQPQCKLCLTCYGQCVSHILDRVVFKAEGTLFKGEKVVFQLICTLAVVEVTWVISIMNMDCMPEEVLTHGETGHDWLCTVEISLYRGLRAPNTQCLKGVRCIVYNYNQHCASITISVITSLQ